MQPHAHRVPRMSRLNLLRNRNLAGMADVRSRTALSQPGHAWLPPAPSLKFESWELSAEGPIWTGRPQVAQRSILPAWISSAWCTVPSIGQVTRSISSIRWLCRAGLRLQIRDLPHRAEISDAIILAENYRMR